MNLRPLVAGLAFLTMSLFSSAEPLAVGTVAPAVTGVTETGATLALADRLDTPVFESKTTVNSRSNLKLRPARAGWAELGIARIGPTFVLLVRQGDEPWRVHERFYRMDLPRTVQVGLVAPDAIQHLMRRVVGPYRAERLLVQGALIEAEQAHAIGLVDELTDAEHVAVRARAWLEDLLKLPSGPMLATRQLARADLVSALADFTDAQLDGFVDGWFAPDTQAALQALVARLKK